MKKQIFLLILTVALIMGCTSAGAPSFSVEGNETRGNAPAFNRSTEEVIGIIGHDWKLTEVYINGRNTNFNRYTLPEAAASFFTLNFDESTVSGVGAPNRYSAPYSLGNNQTVTISLMRSTMMATFIEPENLNEPDYFFYLQNANSWKLANNSLELLSKTRDGGEVRLIFLP